MADIAGVSFSIAQPIVNSGVNPLRESENKETAEELRATSAPQRDQAANSEPSDVPAEQSVSSRLNFSVPTAENTTEENTTAINEQVVVAVEQQIQQANIEANANRPETTDQNNVDPASEQTVSQAAPQQNSNIENTVEATNTQATATAESNTAQEPATNAPQTQPAESSQASQNTSEASVETVAPAQSQTTTEQPESQNPEVGLGLNSGSIIDVTA